MNAPQIICIGEILFDCLADQLGRKLEDVKSWTGASHFYRKKALFAETNREINFCLSTFMFFIISDVNYTAFQRNKGGL